MALEVGARIGSFCVVRVIDEDDISVRYEVANETSGYHVALRLLTSEAAADPEIPMKFMQEARAMALSRDPSRIILDVGQIESGQLFMVLALRPDEMQ